MNLLRFYLARIFGHEQVLANFSLSKSEIEKALFGKSVAIVGNARALSNGSYGPLIDAADLVIRINGAPMPSEHSHGNRTDWLAISVSPGRSRLEQLKPAKVLWMTRVRKRLPYFVASHQGFYLNTLTDWQALQQRNGKPPTTGLMIIDLVAGSQAKSVALYGFDFFKSQSLSGRRQASQVPHDFNAEQDFVERLLRADSRFSLQKNDN